MADLSILGEASSALPSEIANSGTGLRLVLTKMLYTCGSEASPNLNGVVQLALGVDRFRGALELCAKAMGQVGSIVALTRACESPGCQIKLSKECVRKRLKLLLSHC